MSHHGAELGFQLPVDPTHSGLVIGGDQFQSILLRARYGRAMHPHARMAGAGPCNVA